MAKRLTRAHLAALTLLHQRGRAYGVGAVSPSSATLDRLRAAGLAQHLRVPDNDRGVYTAPVLNAYATSDDRWQVEVPAQVPDIDRPAVARAVIRGAHRARCVDSCEYRPRVTPERVHRSEGGTTHYVYREV